MYSIGRWVRVLKSEIELEVSDYYSAIFSRKEGPVIAIALCVLTIVSFILLHI
jgi:hypothetical protein